MKRYIILLMLVLIPCAFALKTGVIVDVQGDVYKGCVDISKGDSAYDVLNKFDDQNVDVEMTINGVVTRMPYLASVNGVGAKTVGDKFYGWFFWIKGDNQFDVPPNYAGLGDYKISQSNEIIATNFAYERYDSSWNLLESAEKPGFVSYESLCEKLKIKDVEFEVNGKRESGIVDIKPGSKLEIEAELENLYTNTEDIDLEDVYFEAIIDDLDIELESDERDISAADDKKLKVTINLPLELDSDDYDLELKFYAKDGYGLKHKLESKYTLEVDKEKHDILITSAEVSQLSCKNTLALDIELLNTGQEDEDVTLNIISDKLGINKQLKLTIKENNKLSKKYYFNLETVELGKYPLTVKVIYGNDEIEETLTVSKVECAATTSTTQEPTTTNKITTKAIQEITPENKKDISPIIIMGGLGFLILLGVIALVLI